MGKMSDEVSIEQLSADFKVVVADAEALLKATVNQGGEKVAGVRAKTKESLAAAKSRIARVQAALRSRREAAAKLADEYVRENPWKVVGFATGFALVIGFLISRR